jgi:hypothetical protein
MTSQEIDFYLLQDRSNAQVSCAGLYIASNLGFDYSGVWLHIDMAAPVHSVGSISITISGFLPDR